MFRKGLTIFLLFAFAACALASCGPATDSPADDSSAPESVQSVSSESDPASSSVPSSIFLESIVPDESPAESSDDSSEESEETSWPDPVFPGGNLDTPIHPDDAPVSIRSLRQVQDDVLLVYGEIDPEDEETAAVLQQLRDMIDGYDKHVSFCAYALDGSRAITYNCEEQYFSACTIKTGFLLYCCLAIEQGLTSADEVMYYQEKYYHKGSGKIKDSAYGTPYTLGYLIQQALTISDNSAYEMLSAYFGHSGYNKMIGTLGLDRLALGGSIWSYRMTARDLAIVWRELYFYFQTESRMANLYYNACTNTPFNYATVYLKEKYSHKSGDNFGANAVYNDGAIIWAERPYVIAILNNSEGEPKDIELVGTIVKIINDSLMK